MRLVARLNPEWCDRSPGCPASRVCPQEAIAGFKVDPAKCTGCGMCASVCPRGAIQMEPAGDDQGRKAVGL